MFNFIFREANRSAHQIARCCLRQAEGGRSGGGRPKLIRDVVGMKTVEGPIRSDVMGMMLDLFFYFSLLIKYPVTLPHH